MKYASFSLYMDLLRHLLYAHNEHLTLHNLYECVSWKKRVWRNILRHFTSYMSHNVCLTLPFMIPQPHVSISFEFATMKLSLSFVFVCEKNSSSFFTAAAQNKHNQKWVRDNIPSSCAIPRWGKHQEKKFRYSFQQRYTKSRGAWCFHQIFTYSSRQSFCKLLLLLLYSTLVVVLSMIFPTFSLALFLSFAHSLLSEVSSRRWWCLNIQ